MKINRKQIITLAKKHFIVLNESEIDNLLFEINNFTLLKIKDWKKNISVLSHLPPTNLPYFIKLNSKDLQSSELKSERQGDDGCLFQNTLYQRKNFVVVAKVNKPFSKKNE